MTIMAAKTVGGFEPVLVIIMSAANISSQGTANSPRLPVLREPASHVVVS